MRRLLVTLLPLALVATACGGSGSKSSNALYTASATGKCLSGKGYTVSTSDSEVSLVIQSADLGGLRAWKTKGGNQLQIAFVTTPQGVRDELRAIRRVAPKSLRPHIGDITRVQRNAVLLWTVAPSQQEEQDAVGCLSS